MPSFFCKARLPKAFTLTELAVIILIIAIFILLLTPYISKIRLKAKFIACEENLREIGLGLKLYANDHQGKFPTTLSDLLEGGYVEDERSFNCPFSPHLGNAAEPDYHYTTEYAITSPSDSKVVFDKSDNHADGQHVLYVSGDIVWEQKEH
jgi:competence protein ComGC